MTAAAAGERWFVPCDSVLHRLPGHIKIAAAVGFVLVVVATPITVPWAFAWFTALVIAVAVAARLPPGRVLGRMTVELPFVAFALLLPFVGRPPSVEVLGMSVSQAGLLAAASILAKATLGVATSVVLAATTRPSDLIDGLARLHVPPLLVEIASFMLRYAQVATLEWRRMSMARAARGFDATGPRAWAVQARSAGALFIRSYERGERVHLAMQSRGYTGRMPLLDTVPAGAAQWAGALCLPLLAACGAILAVAQ